jgi:hypothetical protein
LNRFSGVPRVYRRWTGGVLEVYRRCTGGVLAVYRRSIGSKVFTRFNLLKTQCSTWNICCEVAKSAFMKRQRGWGGHLGRVPWTGCARRNG